MDCLSLCTLTIVLREILQALSHEFEPHYIEEKVIQAILHTWVEGKARGAQCTLMCPKLPKPQHVTGAVSRVELNAHGGWYVQTSVLFKGAR